ncbi:MAG: kelch repeat-containing protein [Planctomycetota bacterium]
MTRPYLRALLCALLITAFSQQAFAHFVWVVTSPKASDAPSIQVYFGETPKPGDPALLSYIEDVELMLLTASGEARPVTLEKAEAAMVARIALDGGVVIGSRDLGEMERGGTRFALKYHFKAGPEYGSDAWVATETDEHLPLDVVPQRGSNGDLVLQVLWKGQPLAGAEIVHSTLDAPSTKAASGDDGTYTVSSPKAGTHAVRVKHAPEDPTAEVPARHYTTLTFEVPSPPSIHVSRGPDFPLAVSSHGAAFSDGYLYAFGGHAGVTHTYSTETTSGRFFRWKPNRFGANEWEELASEVHVQGMGLVAHDGDLYRIGGARPRNAPGEAHDIRSVASCSVFRPAKGAWENFTPLPAPRSSFDAIVWNEKIIVVGGWQMRGAGEKDAWSNTTLMLDLHDPDAGWQSIPQPFERRALGCAVLDDRLYVIGGLTAEGDVVRFVDVLDLKTMEWTDGPEIPGSRMNGFTPAVCSFNGQLLVSPADGQLYRLDGAGTSWESIGGLQQSRFVHRMVPIDGRTVAVLCGASTEGNRTSVELVEFPTGGAAMAGAAASSERTANAGVQERCPVMQADFVSEDGPVVQFNGVDVKLCCEMCEKKWNAEPEAYLNVALLPQLAEQEIPARKIEQVYCPVFRDRVVSSLDPTKEIDGKTIYFFSRSALRRYGKNPDRYPIDESLFRWADAAGSQ